MYVPVQQAPNTERGPTIVARTALDSSAATAQIRAAVSAVDRAVPVDHTGRFTPQSSSTRALGLAFSCHFLSAVNRNPHVAVGTATDHEPSRARRASNRKAKRYTVTLSSNVGHWTRALIERLSWGHAVPRLQGFGQTPRVASHKYDDASSLYCASEMCQTR
jgi:hypothetical protein